MKVNFLAGLPLSEKDKQKKAQEAAIKEVGNAFYSLSLVERQSLRDHKYNELFSPKATTISQIVQTASTGIQTTPATISLPVQANNSTSAEFEAYKIREDTPEQEYIPAIETETREKAKGTFALDIKLNEKQGLAADYAFNGKCFVLTGAAGTGKTTAAREIAKRLFFSGKLGFHEFKIKGEGRREQGPSVAFVAYTNRAASNLAKSILKDPSLEDLRPCITTIHNLLEYEPVLYDIEVDDPDNPGQKMLKTTMRFEPQRTARKPLDITHLIIEESSQVGALDLYPRLFEACRPGTQIIFMGDINQIQPIFSPSILNYALVALPVVELDEVYRQALDSPIISNAHRVLKGDSVEESAPFFRYIHGRSLTKIPGESAVADRLVNSLKKWSDEKHEDGSMQYDPEQDMVLTPFNKHGCGTIEMNYKIAQFLGQKRNAIVYEIIAGIRKLYVAEGDKVMYMKQDGVITKITHNANYVGKAPQSASSDLNRFGQKLVSLSKETAAEDFELTGYENLDIDKIPDENDDKRKQQCSHIVHVKLETGIEVALSTSGELGESNFSLGYALTVHKAQGCEWRKVFILLHRNHAVLLNREIIYTAITRAREYCYVIDLCNVIDKAIKTQKIKGNTTAEKVAWFNSEISLKEPVSIIP